MAASIKVPATFTAVDKFSHVIKGMSGSISKMSRTGTAALDRFDNKVNRTFRKMGNLTRITLGLGLGALFYQGFEEVKNYETGLVGVSKTTGIAGKELKFLGKEIIDTSNKLRGVSSQKLLELAQTAGQLGISGSKDIINFSTTLAKLEKTTDVVGAEGASSIARLLTITGEGPGVVDRFASSLVALGNDSAATESEILGVASEVARATAAYKLQSQQILGISTALKSLDVRPEAAGSAVGRVFRGIEMATLKGGKTLQSYANVMGLSAMQTKELFATDQQKAFSMLIGGLNRISNEGGSVQKTLINLGLSGETVSKGIVPLATNFALLQDKMNLAAKGFEDNTALNKEFMQSIKTIATALEGIKNRFFNLITAVADTGTNLGKVRSVLFYVADNMETIVGIGAGFVGLFASIKAITWGAQVALFAYNVALGAQGALSNAASIAIGKNAVALGAYKAVQVATTAATWVATTAATAFGIAINAGLWPITLIVAAIAGLIALIVNWDSVTEWFGKQWEKFTNWIGGLWDRLTEWFTNFSFKDFFKEIGQSILRFMFAPLQSILGLLSQIELFGIGDMAKGALGRIAELTGTANGGATQEGGFLGGPEINRARSNEDIKSAMLSGSVSLDIRDPGKHVERANSEGPMPIPIKINNTQGAF